MYKRGGKRLFDFFVGLIGFTILSPVFLLTALLLLLVNRDTPFFFQSRPGLQGRIFKIFKFKTMTDAKDADGNLLPDKDRLTWVGSLVRKLSLDEIPQLMNVILGDMSLVGPRPLLVEYLGLYNAEQSKRHDVRPGITGWAQINGRNALSWEKKFELDVWYVSHQSFGLDMKILFLTVLKVLKPQDISSDTSVTMEKFTGSPE
ncbi:sugar transferase [Roseivirga misakiensis]|uniref:UDP-galactose phosphate transferase n=1 Tax=Roseivirga misakiensis TaxID=1563681 RepID=A0A1E5T1F6_9BACT|nr:sugar transferase [Roseivirga misakiensis]OEK05199.1 UDP-galactose phosphate transferase [Roseivirga misakiensis]